METDFVFKPCFFFFFKESTLPVRLQRYLNSSLEKRKDRTERTNVLSEDGCIFFFLEFPFPARGGSVPGRGRG